jgi:hypothetical protein
MYYVSVSIQSNILKNEILYEHHCNLLRTNYTLHSILLHLVKTKKETLLRVSSNDCERTELIQHLQGLQFFYKQNHHRRYYDERIYLEHLSLIIYDRCCWVHQRTHTRFR